MGRAWISGLWAGPMQGSLSWESGAWPMADFPPSCSMGVSLSHPHLKLLADVLMVMCALKHNVPAVHLRGLSCSVHLHGVAAGLSTILISKWKFPWQSLADTALVISCCFGSTGKKLPHVDSLLTGQSMQRTVGSSCSALYSSFTFHPPTLHPSVRPSNT